MARIQIDFPSHTLYSQQVRVRVTDVNAANHMGFDNMVGVLNDVSAGFLQAYGVPRVGEGGVGVIFTDLAVTYLSEAFCGDTLTVEVAVETTSPKSVDLFLQSTNSTRGKTTSLARIGVLFFDYRQKRSVPIPKEFLKRITPAQ